MEALLTGSVLLSLFHALIPSHWLPVVAIGRQEGWPQSRILWVTVVSGSAHAASTVLAGVAMAIAGQWLAAELEAFTRWIAPALLVALGLFFVYRHYFHHHFHLNPTPGGSSVVWSLVVAMFFSPCLEIEGYFLAAGQYGWPFVALLAGLYTAITVSGMALWVLLVSRGLKRLDWHAWEHAAGLITGLTLIFSGGLLFWFE